MKLVRSPLLALGLGVLVSACGGSGSSMTGANSGGAPGTGGSAAGTGGSGGAITMASGGAVGTGGVPSTGGEIGSGGLASGGRIGGTGGEAPPQGSGGAGMRATGGSASGGNGGGQTGGRGPGDSGGHVGAGGAGNHVATGGAVGSGGAAGSAGGGTCTASKAAGASASGTGPHKVTVEINSDAGIKEGTIFRPTDLGGSEKYPIFVWGEGGCSENGLSTAAAMGEIASHGYFVIADGVPNGTASRSMSSGDPSAMGAPLLAYIAWAIAENEKPCSAYYQSLDTAKIGANGFSCGGLMSEGTAGDSRITTWGLNSSGLLSGNDAFYKKVHTPVLIVLGGSGDIAYQNGERDYQSLSALGVPILLFSKDLGHGGDLFSAHGGDFTKIDLAWLDWQLKGDVGATGKGLLIGSTCPYCSDSAWEMKSANIQ